MLPLQGPFAYLDVPAASTLVLPQECVKQKSTTHRVHFVGDPSTIGREKCKTQFSVISSLPRKRESSMPNGGRRAVDSRFRGNDGWDSEFCTLLIGRNRVGMLLSRNHSGVVVHRFQ